MPYVSLADLAERPGAQELSEVATAQHLPLVEYELMDATLRGADRSAWSADEIAAADAVVVRIEDAISDADALIDGYLAKRGYPLPLNPVHRLVTGWSRAITRYLLNKDRISDPKSDPVARDYNDALRFLAQVADGSFSIGADDPLTTGSSTDVRFGGEETVFNRDQLRGFR